MARPYVTMPLYAVLAAVLAAGCARADAPSSSTGREATAGEEDWWKRAGYAEEPRCEIDGEGCCEPAAKLADLATCRARVRFCTDGGGWVYGETSECMEYLEYLGHVHGLDVDRCELPLAERLGELERELERELQREEP